MSPRHVKPLAVSSLVLVCLLGGSASRSHSGAARDDDADKPGRLKLFREWTQTPDAVIVFSGQQHGYLEPCGCSPQFQKGGLARRLAFINSLRQKKWPLVLVDLGGILEDDTEPKLPGHYTIGQEQALAKLEIAFEAMQHMAYTVVNFSPEELGVPNGYTGLMGTLININNPSQPRLLNTNLKMKDEVFIQEGLLLRSITREVGKLKIAFLGVVGEAHKDRVNDPEIERWRAPDEALGATLKKLTTESDLQVLLLSTGIAEARRLAKKFPDLDVIIHGDAAEETSGRPEWVTQFRVNRGKVSMLKGRDGGNAQPIQTVGKESNAAIEVADDGAITVISSNAEAAEKAAEQARRLAKEQQVARIGNTMLVTIGSKGKYTGTIGISNSKVRFELVPLDDRFEEDKHVRDLLDVKYMQKLDGLKVVENAPRVPHPRGPSLEYVGSEACKLCHPNVVAKWSTTRHARALKTLVEGVEHDGKHIARGKHVNPECVNCHVTGFGIVSGYDGTDKTKHLYGNGCENCHGPASDHVRIYKDPNAAKEDLQRARGTVRVAGQNAEKNLCIRCHDAENDPGFIEKFDKRWEEVEHGEEADKDRTLWPKIRELLSKKQQ